jgi:ureidoacrylate peracid hydrolase
MHKVEFSEQILARIARRREKLHMYEELDAARTALVVVDMQSAFVSEEAAAEIPVAREIIPNINELAACVRETGGIVLWVVSTYGPDEANRWPTFFDHVMDSGPGNRFRDALSSGAPGHEIRSDMDYQPGDVVVEKNRFGAFIGSQGRMEAELRGRGIDTLLITGTVTNVCCETTAREAAAHAFKTVMVQDANAARCDEEHMATLSTFLQAMGDVLPTDKVMAALRKSHAGQPADQVELAS